MKPFTFFVLLCISLTGTAQNGLTYNQVLNLTKEIKVIDRLYLDISNLEKTELDPSTAHQLFKRAFGTNNGSSNDAKYFICGKITRHPDFNLFFLYSEKSTTDSIRNFNLILLTTRKDGTYVSTLEAASDLYYTRNNKPQFHKTRSYLYNDFIIKQENVISAMNKKFEAEYRINDYGVIVFYPKWKS